MSRLLGVAAVCVILVVVSVYSSSASAQALPGLSQVQPSGELPGLMPFYFIANEQGSDVVVIALGGDHLYGIDAAGTVVHSWNSSFEGRDHIPEVFDARPHGGVVWTTAEADGQGYSPAISELIKFDAVTLEPLLVLHYNTSLLSLPRDDTYTLPWLLHANNGTLYLTVGNYVYLMDPDTGAQVGFIQLPNLNPGLGGSNDLTDYGMIVYQAPDDSIWYVNYNTQPNGTFAAWHTSTDGAILSSGYFDIGFTYGLQNFAIDSAGNLYLTSYTADTSAAVIFKMDPDTYALVGNISFGVGTNTAYGSSGGNPFYDIEMSIAWGNTPAEDLIYAYNYLYMPFFVVRPNGEVVAQINTSPYSFSDNGAIVWDASDNSFVITQGLGADNTIETYGDGVFSAVRLDHAGNLLGNFSLPANADGLPGPTSVAVDGKGSVVLGTATTTSTGGTAYGFVLFQDASYVLSSTLGSGLVAIDPSSDTIWVTQGNGSAQLIGVSFTGAQTASLTTTGLPIFAVAALHWHKGSLAFVDGVSDAVYSIDVNSGAVSLLFAVGLGLALSEFSFTSDGKIAVVVGTVDGVLHYVNVNAATGAVISELDFDNAYTYSFHTGIGIGGNGYVTVDGNGSISAPQAQYNGYPTSIVVFTAPQSPASSVLGDPSFVGFLGQSYQVGPALQHCSQLSTRLRRTTHDGSCVIGLCVLSGARHGRCGVQSGVRQRSADQWTLRVPGQRLLPARGGRWPLRQLLVSSRLLHRRHRHPAAGQRLRRPSDTAAPAHRRR
jgi:hypothetical protein